MLFTVILKSGAMPKFNSTRFTLMNFQKLNAYVFYSYDQKYKHSENISTQEEVDKIDAFFDYNDVVGIIKHQPDSL